MLFPWKVVHSSLFFGCPLGLGLKEWSLNTGSCKVPREAGKCRARIRSWRGIWSKWEADNERINSGQVKKKVREKNRCRGCILQQWVTECNLFCCRWHSLLAGHAAEGKIFLELQISQGEAAGGWGGADAEHRDVGSFLLQTADEWQNLLSELIKAPSRELMAYTIASKRKFFHSHDCKLDQTGLHKHIAFSKITCSGKDVAQIGVCKFINSYIYFLRIFYELRGRLGARGWILIKIPAFLEWNSYNLGARGADNRQKRF